MKFSVAKICTLRNEHLHTVASHRKLTLNTNVLLNRSSQPFFGSTVLLCPQVKMRTHSELESLLMEQLTGPPTANVTGTDQRKVRAALGSNSSRKVKVATRKEVVKLQERTEAASKVLEKGLTKYRKAVAEASSFFDDSLASIETLASTLGGVGGDVSLQPVTEAISELVATASAEHLRVIRTSNEDP